MLEQRLWTLAVVVITCGTPAISAAQESPVPSATLVASGLSGASGSAVGPDGALYVTEGALGRVSRIDPDTGDITTFASGLPPSIVGLGGPIDVAFVGNTAYVLVTLVGSDVGGSAAVGLYRVESPVQASLVADIGTFAMANPPTTAFDVPTGLQFALEPYRDGFLVTDGHHNRVLRVDRRGEIDVFHQFGNIVPTGLAIRGDQVFIAEAGAVPHLPADGRVVMIRPPFRSQLDVAAGAPLLVDVEFGRRRLYALSQGTFPPDGVPASPAVPNTGALLEVVSDGSLRVVASGLDVPTSLEFIGDVAYVVTLSGEVWRFEW